MSGRQLVGALVAILVATVVVPPAAAWSLNRIRVGQTAERARIAVARLQSSPGLFAGFEGAGVACGPGRMPDLVPATVTAREAVFLPAHRGWLDGARPAPEVFGAGMPTDAWGRCFLLDANAWASGEPVWLLSAGPNGLVDTPRHAVTLGGDDIGGRLR